MSPIEFKAPWSRSLKHTTTVGVLILGILILIAAFFGAHFDASVRAIMIGIPLLALAGGIARTVRGYAITQYAIFVRRIGRTTVWPLDELQSIEGKADAMQSSWRIFGVAGFFAYTGLYWKKRTGFYRAYATDPSRAVVLQFKKHKVVITPHDPQHFIVRARTMMGTKEHRV